MSSHRGGGVGGRGVGGGGGGRSLLSGKAKREQMKEKRDKERLHAEKKAAWEKRQQQQLEQEQQQLRSAQQQLQQPGHSSSDERESAHSDGPTHSHPSDEEVLAVRRTIAPSSSFSSSLPSASSSTGSSAAALSSVPSFAALESSGAGGGNRLRSLFARESKEEIERRKQESRRPLQRRQPLDGSCVSINPWREAIDIPTRPAWSSSTSAAELHASESAYFTSYLQRLYSRYPVSRLNHFEHNLEVWRQLWRVCEQSHVLLLIVDCRYPLINFPPSLHHYVSVTLRKPLLLLLNKVDLIPRSAVQAWMAYFHRHYPTLHVVAYSSQSKGREGSSEHFDVLVRNRAKKPGGGQLLAEAFGVAQLLQAVRALVRSSQVEVDDEVKERFSFEPTNIQQAEGSASSSAHAGEQLTADARREDEEGEEAEDDGGDEGEDAEGSEREHLPTAAKKGKGKQKGRRGGRRRRQRPADGDGGAEEDEADASNDAVDYEEEQVEGTDEEPLPSQYRHLLGQLEEQPPSSSSLSGSASSSASASAGPPLSRSYLTLGTLGTPNAGKSSLINSLCRRKLVSVSKTPGHTKYLQTLFLNPHTRLCDCPGLVFPALDLPKAMQTLAGSFPIAQTRDPYSAVRLLAETVPLEKVYKLQPTPVDERGEYTYGDGEEGEAGWEWTAWSICEAFAYQKGYRNRHGALDLYRAANQLCRDALEGTTVMYTTPPPEDDDAARTRPARGLRHDSGAESKGEESSGRGARNASNGHSTGQAAARAAQAEEEEEVEHGDDGVATSRKGRKGRGRRRRKVDDEDDVD